MRVRNRAWALVLVFLFAAAPNARAATGKVALTFDDLPALSVFADQPYVNYLNFMLLRGLRRHHLPAIGFVNESKLDEINRDQQIANLEKWLDAGMNLGNHTFSHESPDALGARGYIEDIVRGEPVTRGLLKKRGKPLDWFRHPYLETGVPAAVKHEIDDWLAAHGPYAKIRHPQYEAFVLVMFGFLLQWPTLLTLAMFPILLFMYWRLAKAEERDSLAAFGQAYIDYMRTTPAYVPWARPRNDRSDASSSVKTHSTKEAPHVVHR